MSPEEKKEYNKKYFAAWYAKNKTQHLVKHRKYYQENKEELCRKARERRNSIPRVPRIRKVRQSKFTPEEIREKNRINGIKWRAKNKERLQRNNKLWREKNPDYNKQYYHAVRKHKRIKKTREVQAKTPEVVKEKQVRTKELTRLRARKYYLKHREKVLAKVNERNRSTKKTLVVPAPKKKSTNGKDFEVWYDLFGKPKKLACVWASTFEVALGKLAKNPSTGIVHDEDGWFYMGNPLRDRA